MTKHQQYQILLIRQLGQVLSQAKSVIVRLKCLVIIHKLLLRRIGNETIEMALRMLIQHLNSLSYYASQKVNVTQIEEYFTKEVEIPYLHLLNKIALWKMIKKDHRDIGNYDIGFSQINKIKEILQFRKIFHHYGCYYPSHIYALSIFQVFIENIKILWDQVCQIIKKTSRQAIESNKIELKEYLFIAQGEQTQEMIQEFVYGPYFSKRIREDLEIKNIRLLKDEIQVLQNQRRKKEVNDVTMETVKTKRQMRKIVDKDSVKVTGLSEQNEYNDHKMNTTKQIEVLQFILVLQDTIKFE